MAAATDNEEKRKGWRPPWDIPLRELSEYDWWTAVSKSKAHHRNVSDLRHAKALMDFAGSEHRFIVWATQETIRQQALTPHIDTTERALLSLQKSGAIWKKKIGTFSDDDLTNLPPLAANGIRARKDRGYVYQLNLSWAHEIIQEHKKAGVAEPFKLRRGKQLAKVKAERAETVTVPDIENDSDCLPSEHDRIWEIGLKSDSERLSENDGDCLENGDSDSSLYTKINQVEDYPPTYQKEPLRAHMREEEPVLSAYDQMNEFFYEMQGSCPSGLYENAILASAEDIQTAFETGTARAEIERIWNNAMRAAA